MDGSLDSRVSCSARNALVLPRVRDEMGLVAAEYLCEAGVFGLNRLKLDSSFLPRDSVDAKASIAGGRMGVQRRSAREKTD